MKNKHLTLDDRIEIQECLSKKMTFKAIGALIGKDQTTVSKEVKLHAIDYRNDYATTEETCPRLLKAPFVCNGCEKKTYKSCHHDKRIYSAKAAQEQYKKTLVESREGIQLNKVEFYENDRLIKEGIDKGQHLYHILSTQNISVSKSTVYRYFNDGLLSVVKGDLPRAVKFKPRSKKLAEYVPKGVKIGRSYEDFQEYMEDHSDNYVELDTVIGNPGGKVILTIHFVCCNFMVGILVDSKTAADTSSKIIEIKEKLKAKGYSFGDVFPVILTDNGGEFSDVFAFELDSEGNKETSMFFCDPMQSCQKPHIEKNHTLFRDIIHKGESFDNFTQATLDLIFSHINSTRRKIFNGKCPYDMFTFMYSKDLADIFNIKRIPDDEVVQNEKLLRSLEFKNSLSR